MSLLINGMDMPKGCFDCPCCAEFIDAIANIREYNCQALNNNPICVIGKKRRADCPLSETPTHHGRLIDADAHIQSLKENQCGERCRKNHDCVNCGIGMYIRIVENEPTVIQAEE